MSVEAQLETALLRELEALWKLDNVTRFGNRMTAPVFALSDVETKLGRWIPQTRRIELQRKFVFEHPWLEVIGVFEHEMAHQYCDEVLRVDDEPAHGPTFTRICAERGIDARAGGPPIAASGEVDRTLERIKKLLALAGSENRHEAESAMQKAHALMLRHNIDAAAAARDYVIRQVGEPAARSSRVEGAIMALLAEHFFVQVISVPAYDPKVGKRGSVFEISGTLSNVEMALHVHAFLMATADRLWAANRTDQRVKSGRDRLSYQSGVIDGFREKLVAERRALKGTGLVWVGDADLEHFFHHRHPRITTRRRTVRLDGAHTAGREAGRRVVLNKPVTSGPSPGGPRLLRD